MKRIIYTLLIALSVMFSSQYVFSQDGSIIDSLNIIPTNPTDNDNIQLICSTTFTSGECELQQHSVNVQDDNKIIVTLNYSVGECTTICNSVDTLNIGTLNAGDYELIVSLTINIMDAIFDTDTINFTVTKASNVSETALDNDIWIYPNPCSNDIQIKTAKHFTRLEIYSAIGTKIRQMEFNPNGKINVSDLTNGLYFIVLTEKNGTKHTRKILKNL